ncbi:argonaute-like protein [Crassisporium funariophilum]|nr:argonaute-like protein [Crassisporium funariophilum]
MPPRSSPSRGGPRGGNHPPGGRGGGANRGSRPGGVTSTADSVKTFAVKRPGFGTAGRPLSIFVNAFKATVTDKQSIIYHYDVVEPATLPARFNMELMKFLQADQPGIFTPKIVYDGRKIAFAPRKLPLGDTDSQKVLYNATNRVLFIGPILPQTNGGNNPTRPPRVYHITLTKVAEINPEVLERYLDKLHPLDETVLTTLTAYNVVIRMKPNLDYPFNKRSFYTPQERRDIGGGIELWRGIFQSVRPTLGRLIVNVDLATGMMYKEGPLINLCISFAGRPPNTNPNLFSPTGGLPEYQRIKLQKFLVGLRVLVSTTGAKPRVIRGLSKEGASQLHFTDHEGKRMSVAQYFQGLGRPLQYPSVICVQIGTSAFVPLEACMVPRGQIMRKQIPDDKVKDVLDFSTKKPEERLRLIKQGIQNLQYGQSEYVAQFGLSIDTEPVSVEARIIDPPKLRYSDKSRQPTIVSPFERVVDPLDKQFYQAAQMERWIIVIYESQNRFPIAAVQGLIRGFLEVCDMQLLAAGTECVAKMQGPPSLIVVVLPDGGGDIYTAVKHFGDITMGVATQCLKAMKCRNAKQQYWANVLLKVNVKLGGINVIPDPQSARVLTDPANPTIVIGATDRPSFTALVGSIDQNTAKYVATSRIQKGGQEIIDDMKDMCKVLLNLWPLRRALLTDAMQHIFGVHKAYRENFEKKKFEPKRLIFYRDGVSEGQFRHVLDLEACQEMNIRPKITLIIVGKRHHIQLFPTNPQQGDKSGNCPAGTVLDRDVTHPTDHDFYLQSHAGLLGTSRSAHYSVLHDVSSHENIQRPDADSLQALSFALCHVYARSTRSVSIPAPVYYADIVCSRAKTHFDPQGSFNLSDTASNVSGSSNIDSFKQGYKPLHPVQQRLMYFSVRLPS